MNDARNYKRKNYFINKKFQGRYMFNFYLVLTLVLLIFTILLSYYTSQHHSINYVNYDLQVTTTSAMLFKYILLVSWIILIPLGLFLSWVVMRQTHRIAGPLFKFEMVLAQMSRGVLDPHVQLRSSDDGQEVVAGLRDVNRFIADKVVEMRGLTDQLVADPTVNDSPQLQKIVAGLQQSLAEFEIKD